MSCSLLPHVPWGSLIPEVSSHGEEDDSSGWKAGLSRERVPVLGTLSFGRPAKRKGQARRDASSHHQMLLATQAWTPTWVIPAVACDMSQDVNQDERAQLLQEIASCLLRLARMDWLYHICVLCLPMASGRFQTDSADSARPPVTSSMSKGL